MFNWLKSAILRGMVVVLPLGLTLWLLWWFGTSTEALLHRAITLVLPEHLYRPGMGIAAAVALLLVAGTLVNALIVRRLFASGEAFLDRIPVVKTIYGASRDFMKLLPAAGGHHDLRRVVLARFGDALVIGFVTRDDAAELGLSASVDGLVAVYFPMSYQIGGYTALLPRTAIEPLDLPVETAMRLVLTGGLSGGRTGSSGGA
ncbi:MAG: DUF502 domain-containing protein [Gammaproteobacteria bacterium]|nr:MAG: DUF502 domain-containing protein [Gammaproteobacteria bacterium]